MWNSRRVSRDELRRVLRLCLTAMALAFVGFAGCGVDPDTDEGQPQSLRGLDGLRMKVEPFRVRAGQRAELVFVGRGPRMLTRSSRTMFQRHTARGNWHTIYLLASPKSSPPPNVVEAGPGAGSLGTVLIGPRREEISIPPVERGRYRLRKTLFEPTRTGDGARNTYVHALVRVVQTEASN